MKKIYIWLLLLLFATPAFADSTINNLGAGSALSGTEQIPMFQGANPAVTTTPSAIKTYIAPVTSVATSCGVSGGPITSTGTITANIAARNNTATTDTVTNTDCGKVVTESNSSAVAVAITTAGFASGNYVTLKNIGAGTATYTPSSGTIGGSATLALTTSQSVDVYFDGTNFITLPGIVLSSVGVPKYQVGKWYLPQGVNLIGNGTAFVSANTIVCTWGYAPTPLTIDSIGAHVTTVGTTNIQIALYANGADGLPSTLLSSTGNIANTSTGARTGALGANVQLGPNTTNGDQYWSCVNSGDGTVVFSTTSSFDPVTDQTAGAATADALWNSPNTSNTIMGFQCTGAACNGGSSTLGTWPVTLTGTTWTGSRIGNTSNTAVIQFHLISVP